MLFKLAGKLLKNLKWVVSALLLATGLFYAYTQYTAIQQGPLGGFLPETPSLEESFSNIVKNVNPTPEPTEIGEISKVKINTGNDLSVIFSVELAETPEERALGLMYRESMPQYSGMLFIHEYDNQIGYWMKNCEIPLDIIFINKNLEVVDVKNDVPPCKESDPKQENCPVYSPSREYRYVLEINGEIAKESGIQKGQEVEFIY